MSNPCYDHHWDAKFGDNRCKYCQMKYSYWQDVVRAYKRDHITLEEFKGWACKPHYHSSEGKTE